jgi:hypothetical protein
MMRGDPALRNFAFREIKTEFEFLVNSKLFPTVTRV